MKLSSRMLAATIAATVFTSGLVMAGTAEARSKCGQPAAAYDALTTEKQTQFDGIMKDFADRTSPLREKIRAKSMEMDTLGRSTNVDPKAVQAASQELASLQTQMDKERTVLRDKMAKEMGIEINGYSMGSGMSMHHNGGNGYGMGRHNGGKGNGMYGSGMGRHNGMGNASGASMHNGFYHNANVNMNTI